MFIDAIDVFNAHLNQPWLRLWLVLLNDLGHGGLEIISNLFLVVKSYWNSKFIESFKG